MAIFANAFAYISDITTKHDRTLRITILDVCYLSTMPTGVFIGKTQEIIKYTVAVIKDISHFNYRYLSLQQPLEQIVYVHVYNQCDSSAVIYRVFAV